MRFLAASLLSFLAVGVLAAPPVTEVPTRPPTLPPTLPPSTTLTPTYTLPTATITRPTILPTPDTCICPGKLLCCKAVVDASDPAAQQSMEQLGGYIKEFNVTVGLGCIPFDDLKEEEAQRCRFPVCCMDAKKPEIAAIGCVPVPIPTPKPTFTTVLPTTITTTITRTTLPPIATIKAREPAIEHGL